MPVVAAPALIAVAAALLALLILYGIKYFVQAVAHLMPRNIPLIGDFLYKTILAIGAAAMAVIQWIMADFIRPAINWVLAPVYAFLNWMAGVETAVDIFANQIVWLIAHGIPQLAADLRHLIRRLVDGARALAHRLVHDLHVLMRAAIAHALATALAAVHDARVLTRDLVDGARALAHRLHDNLESWATRAIAASLATALSHIHSLRVWTAGELDKVRGIIHSELAVAEGYTDTAVSDAIKAMQYATSVAIAGVIQTVDVDTVAPLAAAWPGIIDDVTTLEGVIATDLPDIGAAIRAIPRAVPTDLTGALAIVGAISVPMLRYMRDCGIPNCRNLSSLGRELANLLDDLAGGAFLAMLIALAADPAGTARFLHDNVEPIAEDAIGAARNLIGV